MKKFRIIIVALGLLPLLAGAQSMSLQDFLKLRKENGISQATAAEQLQTLIGTKTIEVAGVVRGTIETDKGQMLILDMKGGGDLYIDGKSFPAWIKVSLTPARIIIRTSKTDENSLIKSEFIGAASEAMVAEYDAAHAPRHPKVEKTSGSRPVRTGGSRGSRGGGRPSSTPGGNPTISGSIGSGRTAATSVSSQQFAQVLPAYSDFAAHANPRLSQDQADQIADSVIRHSVKYGLDARLVMAVIQIESDFNPHCTSGAGAMGLGQLMRANCEECGISDPYNIDQNIFGTCVQLKQHFDRYADRDDETRLVLTLAAFNAGPGAVKRFGGVPPYRETQNYVRKVTDKYRQLCG